MNKPHWFPFYPNDFLGSSKVSFMTNEEVGIYLFLLCHQWNDPTCSLPSNTLALQKLSRSSTSQTVEWPNILACFRKFKGRLRNMRLYEEWQKVQSIKQMNKEKAEKQWQSRRNATALPEQMPRQCSSQSQSQSQSQLSSSSELETSSELIKRVKRRKNSGALELAPALNSVLTWEAYSNGYRKRYGVDPVRNQSVNSQLKQLVLRLGSDEAPQVATFYLTHNNPLYVSARHPANLLLRDCEGLRTQWATGVKATRGEAKNAEARDDAQAQIQRVDRMLKEGF